ncbi:hypothetical protein BYT27DRAFT_7247661 [Phlegmacium glaucopus]|nr:hypothetical protein BYT27DRAFT_7247661 [Phlegmacium glaucopus]
MTLQKRLPQSPKNNPSEKRGKTPGIHLETLRETGDKNLDKFGKAEKTKKAYQGHLAQGKNFLIDIIEQQQSEGIECFKDKLSKSSAEGIHSAFAQYCDNMDNQVYAGPYLFDEQTGLIRGCPARAPVIQAVMKAIKTKALTKGAAATWNHAEAMSIEDMEKMMQWSERMCLNEVFENCNH